MSRVKQMTGILAVSGLFVGASVAWPQDWPQWRGPNRDAHVTGFKAPATWPKSLTEKWKTTVGVGDSSPVLVGDRVYTFARQGGEEVVECLDAANGKVVWQDKYPTAAVTGNDSGHPGPRSTPAVGEGKVCTLGANGVLSCLDAATGKVAWRENTGGVPQFHTASSPMIVDGVCIAQTGSGNSGKTNAYNLTDGKPKWTWDGPGPGYGSPILVMVAGTKQVVMLTQRSLVGLGLADGKL
jgi:outer membrane protein assembly factor BamB